MNRGEPLGEKLQSPHEGVEMRIFMAGDVALTGLRDAARYLSVHENTLRRWGDKGLLPMWKLPTGVRRFPINGVLQLREQIITEYQQSTTE